MSQPLPKTDSELLAFLSATPAKIARLLSGLADEELRTRTSPELFSTLENVCHLRDLELQGYSKRIDRILKETEPALADFDGARVAAEGNYNREVLSEALEAFQSARNENVQKLRGLTDAELLRVGLLEGVGRITLPMLAEMMREHDEGHLEDLRVLRQQLDRQGADHVTPV
ncbi:MAG TPA: DinB family protein [Pyrinomonadaceae bacterium]|nr:DinB family protein [Pyrinomonadaceae bacterium]